MPPKTRRFTANHDLLLVDEVNSVNPFFAKNKEKAWKSVAETLNQIPEQMFGVDNLLDWVACKNRTERLLESYRKNELRNVVKSGTEDDFTSLTEILCKVNAAWKDWEDQKQARAIQRKQQTEAHEQELQQANDGIILAGEQTHPEQTEVIQELTDQQMVDMGLLDPGELQYGKDKQKDVSASTSGSGKKPQDRPVSRRAAKTSETETVMALISGDAAKAQQIRELELESQTRIRKLEIQNEKDMKEKEIEAQKEMKEKEILMRKEELQFKKEIKEMELNTQKEIDMKRLENEALRIASEEKKWEAMLAVLKKNNN